MTKLINYPSKYSFFILILTLFAVCSCSTPKPIVSKITGKQIPIDQTIATDQKLENTIAPYRNNINRQLDSVLSYAPEDMDKFKGKWQTTIGNFLADITLEKASLLFRQKYSKNVDICLLNHGGIRASITKGNITTRTAYEIMPFENSLVIAELKGEQIIEMVNYFINFNRPHPIAGIQIDLSEDQKSYKQILIQGKPLDPQLIYTVATSDYLITGGDNMAFFAKAVKIHDMNYKLRSLIIDYFKEHSEVKAQIDDRILVNGVLKN